MSGVKQKVCKNCGLEKEPGKRCVPCFQKRRERELVQQKNKYAERRDSGYVYPERICTDCGSAHREQVPMNKCRECRRLHDKKRYEANKIKALRDTDKTIECPRCGTVRLQYTKNGIKTSCKPCSDKWRAENREYILKYQRESIAQKRQENPEKYKAIQDKHRRENPESVKFQQAKSKAKKFGLTVEQYAEMVKAQNNLCSICGKPETAIISKKDPTPRALHIDHDHATGKVRALLCSGCNTGLGAFRDNPMLLCAAAEYVQYHSVPAWA